MAEPVSNINDAGSPVPSGEDRPRVAREAAQPPVLPGMPVEPERQLTEGVRRGRRLHTAAEKVGGAMGSAVGSMRRAKLRVVGGREQSRITGDISGTTQQARERISELSDTAGEKLSDWKESASETVGEIRERASHTMSDFRSTARDRIYEARVRTRRLVNQYPVHTILAFGALASMVGFTLRIWRSNGNR